MIDKRKDIMVRTFAWLMIAYGIVYFLLGGVDDTSSAYAIAVGILTAVSILSLVGLWLLKRNIV